MARIDVYSSSSHYSKSGTTGQLFTGNKIRYFPIVKYKFNTIKKNITKMELKPNISINHFITPKPCNNWVVITTIFSPSESVRKAAQLNGWCVVVVADRKTPTTYNVNNIVYLSVDAQKQLANDYDFLGRIPWNHFGRKNIGYLYAIMQGAEYIFDMDDDNILKHSEIFVPQSVTEITAGNCSVFNVYPFMGASSHPTWPRGFPLENIKQPCTWSFESRKVNKEELIIFQSLADNDPDVDAIYRMTLSLPFHFKTNEALGILPRVFVPYNAQASMHYKKAFWGLLLPTTVHGRVSDIWRSYFTQTLLWKIESRIAFVPPWVDQIRNSHNYIQDFQAETDLYLKSNALIEFLSGWQGTSTIFPSLLEQLWVEMYERDFIQIEDVELLQSWIDTLLRVGYVFPTASPVTPKLMKPALNLSFENQYKRVLVTGANGMIGSHVVKELCKNPIYEVYGLVRQRSNLGLLKDVMHKIKIIRGDITDSYRMRQIIKELRPHLIIHLAAQGINGISYDVPELTIDTNIRGTLNLLEAVRQADLLKTRILLAGSSTEYGKTADVWNMSISEDAPLQPVSPYGVSKVGSELLAFQYFHSYGMPIIVARFFIQVGIGGTDSLAIQEFSKQVAMIEQGLLPPILRHGNIRAKRDMTDMRLSAPTVVKLAEIGIPGEAYNIGSGNAISMKDVLDEIISQSRVNVSIEEEKTRMRLYDEKVLTANISKLIQLTQWQPIFDLKDVTQNILNYWRREVSRLYASPSETVSSALGAFVTVYSERKKVLLQSLPSWNRCLPWAWHKYPVIIFIAAGLVSTAEQEQLRTAAGDLKVQFVTFEYGWNQKGDRAGGGGGPWVNWLLAKEMYETSELRKFEYIMRFDEDIFFHDVSNLDIFQDMKKNNILVGWKQWILDNEVALGTKFADRVIEYNSEWSMSRGYKLSDVWGKVTDPASSHHNQSFMQNFPRAQSSRWRPYLVAGCVEMYSTSIFQTPLYHEWLEHLHVARELKKSHLWEQEVKTLWMQTYVPLENWKMYACSLPLYHKEFSVASISHWFFHSCNYTTGQALFKGRCDSDPQLRIC